MKTLTALERQAFTAGFAAAMRAWGITGNQHQREGWVEEQFSVYLAQRRQTCEGCNDRPPHGRVCAHCGRVGT